TAAADVFPGRDDALHRRPALRLLHPEGRALEPRRLDDGRERYRALRGAVGLRLPAAAAAWDSPPGGSRARRHSAHHAVPNEEAAFEEHRDTLAVQRVGRIRPNGLHVEMRFGRVAGVAHPGEEPA